MKTVIEMAKEAGLIRWKPNSNYTDGVWWMEADEPGEELERFADLIRADEREQCAKVCDEADKDSDWPTAANCAAAIRARNTNYLQLSKKG